MIAPDQTVVTGQFPAVPIEPGPERRDRAGQPAEFVGSRHQSVAGAGSMLRLPALRQIGFAKMVRNKAERCR